MKIAKKAGVLYREGTFLSGRGRAALLRAALILAALALTGATAHAQTQPALRARHILPFASPADHGLRPHFDIIHGGTSTVALSGFTLRSWFTEDGAKPQTFSCDWTARGCTNVTARFVTLNPARPSSDTYVRLFP
jgi:hypothetical protein